MLGCSVLVGTKGSTPKEKSRIGTAFHARRERQMGDRKEIEKLEAEILRDETAYSVSVYIEGEIFKSISHQGFAPAWDRIRLVGQQQALAEKIRRHKIMLVWARR
jgi:hypothetical protein